MRRMRAALLSLLAGIAGLCGAIVAYWPSSPIDSPETSSAKHPTSWSAPAAPSRLRGFSRRFFDGVRSVLVVHEPDGDRHLVYG
ncbi:hypothetical protein [Candidatus Poriferisodalis sp.]|uniref:hypothetical protein n=1 Tax=Candidatus Poriferisodalis sp. TaxID=3101277 RepID=UPI003D0F4DC4